MRPTILKLASLLLLLSAAATSLFGQSAQPKVVASTSWTAAFARAAGAEEVTVLAPTTLQHPPEYELKPSDLQKIKEADLIIYAGYEQMAPRLASSADKKDALLQITTVNAPGVIADNLMAIARRLGTENTAQETIEQIQLFFDAWRSELASSGILDKPVLVQFHHQGPAAALRIEAVLVFGPAPLEAPGIIKAADTNAGLVIDNYHNPLAAPLRESLPDAVFVQWINFPNAQTGSDLIDVLRYNRTELNEAINMKN